MKKVAAYCRVSTDKEIQQSSLELQMETYRDIINAHEGWELAGIYADEGLTATTVRSRKEFQRMIRDAEDGKIDYIIAKSISRFARNTLDTLSYTRKLKELGVGVIFEEQGLDTLSATSEIFLTIHAAFAQEESYSISENLKHGFRSRAAMGIPKWSPTYGYRNSGEEWRIEPSEAEVVRRIFGYAAVGKSLCEIGKILETEGIPAPCGAQKWHHKTIAAMLRNERYIGDVRLQKTMSVDFLQHKKIANNGQLPSPYLKAHHEPIVSREIFEAAERMLAMKSRHRGGCLFPYYGLLKCPECGGNMVGVTLPSRGRERAWTCTCQPVCIRQKHIDKAVKTAVGTADFIARLDKITTDWESVTVTEKSGRVTKIMLEFEAPSDIPAHTFVSSADGFFINGINIGRGVNAERCYESHLRVRRFLEKIEVRENNGLPTVITQKCREDNK